MPAFLLKREWLLVALGLGFAVLAAAVVYLSRPTVLTVAVGPRDGAEAQLLETYAQALSRAREDVRLNVRTYDDVRDSAAALQAGRADLAVVRPDVFLPDNGLTLALLHEETLLIATPEASEIESFPDLAKKRLGIVERHAADRPFVTNLLAFYDFTAVPAPEPGQTLAASHIALVPLKPGEVTAAPAGRHRGRRRRHRGPDLEGRDFHGAGSGDGLPREEDHHRLRPRWRRDRAADAGTAIGDDPSGYVRRPTQAPR